TREVSEVSKAGGQGVELSEVISQLQSGELRAWVDERNGFYFLRDREKDNLAERRIEAEKLTDMKWRIVRRRAPWIGLIPFVQGVMVTGSMAVGNVHEKSDFDLLVIARAGRIWTARFFLTAFLDLLGWRRRNFTYTKDKFCLNHYVTDESLAIPRRTVAAALWHYSHATPITGDHAIFTKYQEKNDWIGEYLVHYPHTYHEVNQRFVEPPRALVKLRGTVEWALGGTLGNKLERILGALQRQKIKHNPLTQSLSDVLVFSDRELKFHPDSREQEFIEKFRKRVKALSQIES
ncbi:MAG: nucleotidyltransferase domain-containing protein, partial [Parcubacteria group bacterium]|nr:nucleotidyltransferase domain-containing protein [Parcubacteria group bacterium]